MTDTKSFRDNKVTTLKSSSENNMEPVHIFYRELPTAKNNIFTANIAKKTMKWKMLSLRHQLNMQ